MLKLPAILALAASFAFAQDDADIPAKFKNLINAETYHQLRGDYLNTLRGLPADPALRAKAVEQMQGQLRQQLQNQAFSVALTSVTGCAIQTAVRPLPPNRDIAEICILENPKVIIADFLPALQEGIQRNGLRSKVYREVPSTCAYVLEYVAFQKWDFKPFMSQANISLYSGKELVGTASYKLPNGIFGGGGINPAKWDSTKEKIDPLLDELFRNYSTAGPR